MSRGLSAFSVSPRIRTEKRNRESHSSDRLSEWQREIRSDSLPYEDLAALHEGSTSPASSISPLVWQTYNGSVSSTQHHRLRTGEMHFDRANHVGKEGGGTDAGRGTTEEFYSPYATENAEEHLFRRGRGMSSRPWTTGQFGKLKRAGIGDLNCASILGESNTLLQVREQEMPRNGGDRRLRKRRPQTAKFPARPCDDEELSQKVFTWEHVWQSLQTSQIVSGRDALVEAVYPRQLGQNGPADRLRRVDFQRQRRARTARRRSARTGGISTGSGDGSVARECNSASEGQANSSDCSAGTANRDTIKRRAADLASSIADSCVILNPSGPISTPKPPTMRKRNCERRREKSQRQQALAGDTSGKARRKTSTSGASNQPFVVMNETTTTTSDGSSSSSSSSEDGRSYLRAEGSRRRAQNSRNCSEGGDVKNRREDCEVTPAAPGVSSLLASRKLGFDLRKSLAAIEEWTEQVTTARDGYGTPRQAATEGGQSILFFVQGERDAATSSCIQERLSDRQDGKVSRQRQRANACPWRDPVRSPAAIAGRAKVTAVDAGRVDSEDNDSEDETVLSVEAARVALGISKTMPITGTIGGSGVAWMPRLTATTVPSPTTQNRPHRPSPAEIDALTGGPGFRKKEADDSTGRDKIRTSHQTEKTSSSTTASGLAIGMSDEALEGMLRQHPRTVPELRTKESFRRFFQGMAEKRMSRLLRSAYEGTLPANEVDRKVKKRLRLVGDMLA